MIKVSVIVPIYNAEKYVRDCLLSLLEQRLSDVEIILVNDGSTDESIASIKDLIEAYPQIILIERENEGAAQARNHGLAVSRGKYISFVDSDDQVKPDFLKALYEACEQDKLDMVCGSFEAIHPKGVSRRMYRDSFLVDADTLKGSELYKRQMQKHDYIPMIWAYLYRRDFLQAHDLRLSPQTLHEDEEFTPRAWILAERAKIIENYNYVYYRNHEHSIIQSRNQSSVQDLADTLLSFMVYYQTLPKERQSAFAYAIRHILEHYVYYSRLTGQLDVDRVKKTVFILKVEGLLTRRLKCKYFIVTRFPRLYYWLQSYEG